MESIRHSAEDAAWPLRPWIWAAICAAGAFAVNRLVDIGGDIAIWRQVAATFIMVTTLAFVLTAERRRLLWAAAFALGAATVLAFVGWFTAAYNKSGSIAEYPFLAGIFALLIAAPLFQTVRDEGAWRFPYAQLHRHVWTDAVIAAASLAFTGVSFLLALLIGQLFDLIGIKVFTELLREEWFSAMLSGFAFGAALGLLRERDALVATLQKLVLVVFSVLAPVLAFALVGFLVSLPFTGLAPLWDSGVPTTPVLLFAAAGAVGLINAVIGDGKNDGSQNWVLRWSALLLSLAILPLAVIAAISMGARIEQYGFTPDRIWGLLAIIVACVYGVAYLAAAARSSKALLDWDDHIRPANVRIALGVCALALFLALPILDFGAMSARDQLARLKAGITKAEKFDWQAMAFDFGPKGRAALDNLARNGSDSQKKSAAAALKSENRWDLQSAVEAEKLPDYEVNFVVHGGGPKPDVELKRTLLREGNCRTPCRIIWLANNQIMVVGQRNDYGGVSTRVYRLTTQEEVDAIAAKLKADIAKNDPDDKGIYPAPSNLPVGWHELYEGARETQTVERIKPDSRVEIRTVEKQQVYVDGVPVGEVFAK